jgi:hypothetical protein
MDKSYSKFGSPLFPMLFGFGRFKTPLLNIFPQVQLKAILWGIGTALREIPHFVSSAGIQGLVLLTSLYISS